MPAVVGVVLSFLAAIAYWLHKTRFTRQVNHAVALLLKKADPKAVNFGSIDTPVYRNCQYFLDPEIELIVWPDEKILRFNGEDLVVLAKQLENGRGNIKDEQLLMFALAVIEDRYGTEPYWD